MTLEHAFQLSRSREGTWSGRADPDYEAANGMFGGWTTAVALGAVCAESDDDATPVTITINFVNKIGPGTDILIHTRRVGGGKSVSYWQSELTTLDGEITLATASVVLATRRDTDGRLDIEMPDAPDPETIAVAFPAPGRFGERTTVRPIVGAAPHDGKSTYSSGWVRETSGRAVDHLQLAFLSDHREPRSFFWSDGPRPSTTLSLSVNFHATDEELAAVGDDEVLSVAFGTRGAQATSEEHLRLWSRGGALLATSVQMDWYR